LSQVAAICSICVAWKITRRLSRNLKADFPQRKPAATISTNCDGQKGFVVRTVGTRKLGLLGQSYINVLIATIKFLWLPERFSTGRISP